MHDLRQNELLSAYLDGELTAAEQAEMEQLLATSPAARQLLDELRALSVTLQALPQEKLGEDLSRQVLRVAERRMLTEGEPAEMERAPVPLARSVFRRFFNRRAMVWLSLTTAVAVMIAINERRQGVGPAGKAAREVALVKTQPPAKSPAYQPPSIQASHDSDIDSLKEAKEDLFRSKVAQPPPAVQNRPGQPGAAVPQVGIGIGSRGLAEGKSVEAGLGALVVRCDISPEAAEKRAFDKLLVANGITSPQRRGPIGQAQAARKKTTETMQPGRVDEKTLPRLLPTGEEEIVDVEATAAQIEATVAGLEAQPNVFLSVSVSPAEQEPPSKVARQPVDRGKEQPSSLLKKGATAGLPSSAGENSRKNTAGQASSGTQTPEIPLFQRAAKPLFDQKSGLPREAQSMENRRQLQKQLQIQQLGRPMSQQRVTFVVRVVGGDRPPAATNAGVGVEPNVAKPAEEAKPPANLPTQGK